MRVLEINAYTFGELSEKVQERVLEKFRDMNVDYEWYENTKEIWTKKLKENGFLNAKIEFSGFHSQGDGASFTGEIDIQKMIDTFPEFKSLEVDKINLGILDLNGRYYHSHSKKVTGDYDEWDIDKEGDTLFESFKDAVEQFRQDLCQDIYAELQKEYEYLTSDECIIESFSMNNYEFNVYGEHI